MKYKQIYLLSIFFALNQIYSCTGKSLTSDQNETNKDFSINEVLKANAEKHYHLVHDEDSVNNLTTNVTVIDSFTLKQDIDFRKNQIKDSIAQTDDKIKKTFYNKIIYLLDSIEKTHFHDLNSIVSYHYKYTVSTKTPKKTSSNGNSYTSVYKSKTTSVEFYTDATDVREIIWLPAETKHNIVNPVEYPDYYKRIDRYVEEERKSN